MWDEDRRKWFKKRRWPFFGRGLWNIDEVFRELEEMMEKEFEEFSRRAPRNLVRERTMPDGSREKTWGPFVYGYSVTVGPDGKPHVREFGNLKRGPGLGRPRIDIKERREPLVDVLATNGEVKVVVELPGVEKEDIKLRGTETVLTINVEAPEHKYYKEVRLPTKVDPKKSKSSYKNGVLEVTLQRQEKTKREGEPLKIE